MVTIATPSLNQGNLDAVNNRSLYWIKTQVIASYEMNVLI